MECAVGRVFVLEEQVEIATGGEELFGVFRYARAVLRGIGFFAETEVDEIGGDNFGYFQKRSP